MTSPASQRRRSFNMMDTLKGLALVATFLAILATFAVWVGMWETTWRAAVEPTRASIYNARLGPTQCLRLFWHWRENGCRLI
jgi:hypothetical protein